jgi:hypothetical protein
MARWYSEDEEYSEMSDAEKVMRDRIVAIIAAYTTEMEAYSYCGSNPGVREDDYEGVADDIMKEFTAK